MVRVYVLLPNAYVHCLVPPVTCSPDLKAVTVWADAMAVEQIFANLVNNAINYLDPTRPGYIEIGHLDRPEIHSADFRLFYVKDNGLGIPEKHHGRIFKLFQRVHQTSAPGEGMGLTIVSRIVDRHRGKIWVESTVGEGSTFFVTLPIIELARESQERK